jgi:hypothetical protein
MKMRDVKKLHTGDEVFWNDPDEGTCSCHYLIGSIEIKGDIVSITDKNGDHLECFARELQ